MLQKSLIHIGIAACVSLGACTQRPENVTARYVSPNQYRSWQCEDLWDERQRVDAEHIRIFDLQRTNANADAGIMTASIAAAPLTLGLSLLALPALAATTDRREELGRLRGELDAIDAARAQKACPAPAPVVSPTQTEPSTASATPAS